MIRCARRGSWTVFLVAASLIGCHEPRRARVDQAAASSAPSAPPPRAIALPPASTSSRDGDGGPKAARTAGPIRASLTLDRNRYVEGEPMLATLEVTNTGEETLSFDDRRWRYAWFVRGDRGALLCNLPGAAPRVGSEFVSKIRLAPGETHRETHLVNATCDAFRKSGRYVLGIVRSLSPPDQRDRIAPCAASDGDFGCVTQLTAPWVAAELLVEIGPWDMTALQTRLSTLQEERSTATRTDDGSREGALREYAEWFCENVRCGCPATWNRTGKWAEKALAKIPATMGEGCRRR